jgi:peptidoglycan/LPS O-acetylase OafA/YrhL
MKWALLALNVGLLTWCLTADAMRVLLSLGITALCIMNIYGAMPEKSCSLIQKIDHNSFGVYLFHSPLIYITFANIPDAHPAIVVFINLVVFGAAAFGLTEVIRRTKLKVLIGE